MELYDIYIIAATAVGSVLLFLLADFAQKVATPKWRIVYFVPFALCLVLTASIGFEIRMLPAYIAAILPLAGFLKGDKKPRKFSCAAAAVLCLVSLPLCMLIPGYRSFDYSKDFQKGFTAMKNRYVLSYHKQVDWDALYKEYLPRFRAANDDIDALIAWKQFCAEFHDGHVGYFPADATTDEKYENMCREAYKRLGVNNYGLSMLTLSDGSAAAVNVDASLNSLGIHNGTVITAWDGEDVFAAAENSVVFSCVCYPDIDNEKFFLPAFAACTGGETVSVSFIDDGGSERTETLRLLGDGYDRLNDTLKAVTQGYPAANFEWADIDESTVLLRIKSMQYDSVSSQNENYDRMKQQLTEACAENLKNGKTNLIIDLRSNSGGSGLLVKALGEVFSPPGEHFYCCDGTWDTKTLSYRYDEDSGTFPISATNTFVGENRWQGNKILILVNSDSISAADHLVTIMRGLENVTVMGFTETNGSAQGVGQLPLERGTLSFSGSLVLNADGTPFVDTGADRESGNDIDIRVPLDSQAVTAIFDKGEDYLLSKAVEFFG